MAHAGCAEGHAGAADFSSKSCEGCGLKKATYGVPGQGKKRRWCSGCAKAHAGAADLVRKMCEGCGLKTASFSLPTKGKKKRRWCGGCAPRAARRAHLGGPPQKRPQATDPPLTVLGPDLSFVSKYRLAIGNPYEAATRAGLRVWRALADREEGCFDETGGGQEEGCPEEEMSPAFSPK